MRDDDGLTSDIFAGPSEMHARVRTHDWAGTPLGPVDEWPRSLTSIVKMLLASRYPMILTWGPHFIQFYNDAYSKLIGDKHPAALGIDIRITLAEGWTTLGPLIADVMANRVANWNPALLLLLARSGYPEEAYFDVSHAPAEDDDGQVVGMLGVCSEVTQQVLSDRRLRLLRDLAMGTSASRSVDSTCSAIRTALAQHTIDVPFALLYLREGDQLILREAIGIAPDVPALSPRLVDLTRDHSLVWPFERASAGETLVAEDITQHVTLGGGPWSDPIHSALIMPITGLAQDGARGVLVAGINPNRALDEGYRSFYDLLTAQVSASISNAEAHEEAHQRAEALAQLDRAKTEFFSNVSHELRTPLTLILGPLEELLGNPQALLDTGARDNVEIAHRNALRLLKLVNTLLDFSRIEAGRAEARYKPVDLAAQTIYLASGFRSAIEKAGMELIVECPPLPEPVFVDTDMWEKIVLNLLSNAFKFTQQGRITVRQEVIDRHLTLSVIDTGCGIRATELPHVFKRFHRVAGTVGRTFEGTGIGLALVQELAQLHGGTVEASSVESQGCTFTVSIPMGSAHLPAEHITDGWKPDSVRIDAFVEEALSWLPDEGPVLASGGNTHVQPHTIDDPGPATHHEHVRARILLADDNADMRAFISKLLGDRYDVVRVRDGAAALAAVHEHQPDLLLTDVMMPRIDGVGLLAELRADPRTRTIPIILLSARAGAEALASGLETGADDYLVKPFAARELLARVATHLDLARIRREAGEERSRRAAAEALVRERDQFLALAAHELRTPLTSVGGYLQLVVRRLERKGHLQDRDRRALQVITEQVERLKRLVAVLLDLGRFELDQFALERRPMDVGTLVRRVAQDVRPQLTEQALDLQLSDEPLVISGDELRMEQVLQNLISNAIKYSSAGSVITMRAARQGDHVCISVQDQGIGVPERAQDNIFQRFYRADNVNSEHINGLGIGLYIVKEIVTRHQGSVYVASQEGKGSTFTIEIPLSSNQTQDVDMAWSSDVPASHT